MGQNIQGASPQTAQAGPVQIGTRVVRGHDWCWGEQDDGEGLTGTVIEVDNCNLVLVYWDNGLKINYRAGYGHKFDLRVLDNATTGVEHSNVRCCACRKHGIRGMRWKCARCQDYDLCTPCYMSDKHNLNHEFIRLNDSVSTGVRVPRRNGSEKVRSRGIYPGATVMRGLHWKWGFQDGSPDNEGQVLDIHGWGRETARSAATVDWDGGGTKNYRVGHDGKVDLQYTRAASDGYYYRTHLPMLGHLENTKLQFDTENNAAPSDGVDRQLQIGDRVVVEVDDDVLIEMQRGHGGWNSQMMNLFRITGEVVGETAAGDIRVKYNDETEQWVFNKAVLLKVNDFSVGDTVRICHDLKAVMCDQDRLGNWHQSMKQAAGKKGKVLKIDDQGDVQVGIGSRCWWFSPACLSSDRDGPDRLSDAACQTEDIDTSDSLAGLGGTDLHKAIAQDDRRSIKVLLEPMDLDLSISNSQGYPVLHYAALKDNSFATEMILEKVPQSVDDKKDGGFTALHIAAYNGYLKTVETLMKAGKANLESRTNQGETALHFAVKAGAESVACLLVKNGAEVNPRTSNGDTPLHLLLQQIKENRSSDKIVEIACYLAKHGANLRAKNRQGRTPMDLIRDQNIKQRILEASQSSSQIARTTKPACLVCSENEATVQMEPCGHKTVCGDCSSEYSARRAKRCGVCRETVQRTTNNVSRVRRASKSDAVKRLERPVRQVRNKITCYICEDQPVDTEFNCGHKTCRDCANRVKRCPYCRATIVLKLDIE